MSSDFYSVVIPLGDEQASALVESLSEEEYNGNVYVEGMEPLELIPDDQVAQLVVMSSNFPALVALDRFGLGRKLLGGHASRWVAAADVPSFRHELAALFAAAGGQDALMAAVRDQVERMSGEGEEIWRGVVMALELGFSLATERRTGLVLVGGVLG
jgi:hypothetical protein